MMITTIVQRRRSRIRRKTTGGELQLHIFSFAFNARREFQQLETVLVRGRMSQTVAIQIAGAIATANGEEPWLTDIRSVPAPRATPALDAICRRHTAHRSFLELLTAPASYRPTIRLDLMGREGAILARSYDAVQARWGDPRRAFVTGRRRSAR